MLAERWHGGKLLNLGCAHGPDFPPFAGNFHLYGIDFSISMLRLARKYAAKFNFEPELVQGDVAALPFGNNSFDWAISIATYHHLQGKERQLAALVELKRVLKPGGEAFITVWNRWQLRFWRRGKETMVPWHTREATLYRYYRLFSYGEIEKLVREVGLQITRSFPESTYRFPLKMFSRNICLLVRKKD